VTQGDANHFLISRFGQTCVIPIQAQWFMFLVSESWVIAVPIVFLGIVFPPVADTLRFPNLAWPNASFRHCRYQIMRKNHRHLPGGETSK
jgi:hypothetical protein